MENENHHQPRRRKSRIPRFRNVVLKELVSSFARQDQDRHTTQKIARPPWRNFQTGSRSSRKRETQTIIQQRLNKLDSSLFYLYEQSGPNAFVVTTSEAKRFFKVKIGPQTCDCRRKSCIHLLFVMTRIFKVRDENLLLQGSLKDYEANELLRQYKDSRFHPKRYEHESPECPICLRDLHDHEQQTTCVNGCGNRVHLSCMWVWAQARRKSKSEVMCPICRESWLSRRRKCSDDNHDHRARHEVSGIPTIQALSELHQRPNRSEIEQSIELPAPPSSYKIPEQFQGYENELGVTVLAALFSSDWRIRHRGLLKMKSWLLSCGPKYLNQLQSDAVSSVIEVLCQDVVFSVFATALSLLPICLPSKSQAETILAIVFTRCFESNKRFRDCSYAVASELLIRQVLDIDDVIRLICSPSNENTLTESNWQWLSGRLKYCRYFLQNQRAAVSENNLELLKEWAHVLTQHKHLTVRLVATRIRRLISNFARDQHDTSSSDDDDSADEADCANIQFDIPECGRTNSEMSENHEFMIPEQYIEGEHWTKQQMLGSGACATTFLGVDNNNSTQFAVKQINLKTSCSAKQKIFLAEIELLSKVPEHPNIVQYLGHCQSSTTVNVFMELMSMTLASKIEQSGPLNETLLKQFVKQILLALQHLHSHGIMHRDLKTSNLLLDMSGTRVKLCDFGLAAALKTESTQTNEFVTTHGTPAYMAPEVIRGESYGRRSDIWSLGCIMSEMMTGQPPWQNCGFTNPYALMFFVASEDVLPQISNEYSASCQEFVHLCLTRNATERPHAHDLMQHPWLRSIDS